MIGHFISKSAGKDGKIFDMYKFRSMINECDEDGKLFHPSKRSPLLDAY